MPFSSYPTTIIDTHMQSTLILVPSSTSLHFFFFFFNDTATTEIYTLSLHDALPISWPGRSPTTSWPRPGRRGRRGPRSEEHTSELQSQSNLVCRLLLEKKKKKSKTSTAHIAELLAPRRHARDAPTSRVLARLM